MGKGTKTTDLMSFSLSPSLSIFLYSFMSIVLCCLKHTLKNLFHPKHPQKKAVSEWGIGVLQFKASALRLRQQESISWLALMMSLTSCLKGVRLPFACAGNAPPHSRFYGNSYSSPCLFYYLKVQTL